MTSTNRISLDRWYALAVINGRERSIRETLRKVVADNKLGMQVRDIVLPEQEEIAFAGTPQAKPVMRNKLPGYLLLRCRTLSPIAISKIANAKGVMEFMGGNDTPVEMPAAEVRRILGKEAGGTAGKSSAPRFAVGNDVKVVRGPMSDFTGKITDVNAGKQIAKVSIAIFGRETPVDVSFDDLRLV